DAPITMPYIDDNGTTFFYDTANDGEPLLLLMGLGTEHRGWMLQVPAFKNYKCVMPDNRGCGQNAGIEGPYSIAQMARDAIGVMQAEGAERFHVMGISMGGMIAQEVARQAPDQTATLTLIATLEAPGEKE